MDVVLLDLGLPDSQGLETFVRARRGAPNEPIVVISGLDDERLALEAVRSGAQDYLVKGRIEGHLLARVLPLRDDIPPRETYVPDDPTDDAPAWERHVAGALAFLRREGRFASAPRPDLVLLDLNLPGMDGRELLAHIKEDDQLRHIPVVVVTGSRAEEDVVRSYRLHANAYVTKPIDTKEFLEAVNSIELFWLQIVRLP